jgi:hypothetical protein
LARLDQRAVLPHLLPGGAAQAAAGLDAFGWGRLEGSGLEGSGRFGGRHRCWGGTGRCGWVCAGWTLLFWGWGW